MVESFELHVGGLGVNSPGWLPLLCASLDIPAGSSTVISADGFATLHWVQSMNARKCPRVSPKGFPCGKEKNFAFGKCCGSTSLSTNNYNIIYIYI